MERPCVINEHLQFNVIECCAMQESAMSLLSENLYSDTVSGVGTTRLYLPRYCPGIACLGTRDASKTIL